MGIASSSSSVNVQFDFRLSPRVPISRSQLLQIALFPDKWTSFSELLKQRLSQLVASRRDDEEYTLVYNASYQPELINLLQRQKLPALIQLLIGDNEPEMKGLSPGYKNIYDIFVNDTETFQCGFHKTLRRRAREVSQLIYAHGQEYFRENYSEITDLTQLALDKLQTLCPVYSPGHPLPRLSDEGRLAFDTRQWYLKRLSDFHQDFVQHDQQLLNPKDMDIRPLFSTAFLAFKNSLLEVNPDESLSSLNARFIAVADMIKFCSNIKDITDTSSISDDRETLIHLSSLHQAVSDFVKKVHDEDSSLLREQYFSAHQLEVYKLLDTVQAELTRPPSNLKRQRERLLKVLLILADMYRYTINRFKTFQIAKKYVYPSAPRAQQKTKIPALLTLLVGSNKTPNGKFNNMHAALPTEDLDEQAERVRELLYESPTNLQARWKEVPDLVARVIDLLETFQATLTQDPKKEEDVSWYLSQLHKLNKYFTEKSSQYKAPNLASDEAIDEIIDDIQAREDRLHDMFDEENTSFFRLSSPAIKQTNTAEINAVKSMYGLTDRDVIAASSGSNSNQTFLAVGFRALLTITCDFLLRLISRIFIAEYRGLPLMINFQLSDDDVYLQSFEHREFHWDPLDLGSAASLLKRFKLFKLEQQRETFNLDLFKCLYQVFYRAHHPIDDSVQADFDTPQVTVEDVVASSEFMSLKEKFRELGDRALEDRRVIQRLLILAENVYTDVQNFLRNLTRQDDDPAPDVTSMVNHIDELFPSWYSDDLKIMFMWDVLTDETHARDIDSTQSFLRNLFHHFIPRGRVNIGMSQAGGSVAEVAAKHIRNHYLDKLNEYFQSNALAQKLSIALDIHSDSADAHRRQALAALDKQGLSPSDRLLKSQEINDKYRADLLEIIEQRKQELPANASNVFRSVKASKLTPADKEALLTIWVLHAGRSTADLLSPAALHVHKILVSAFNDIGWSYSHS